MQRDAISYDKLVEKWAPVLNEESAGTITDHHKKAVTAAVLENQEIALREEGMLTENSNLGVTAANHGTTGANWNPVLIALVRRAMPNLMAYDVCGVQPMTGPTGLIFAMKARYNTSTGGAATAAGLIFAMKARYNTSTGGAATGATQADNTEALFNEALVNYSGDSTTTGNGTKGSSGLYGVSDTDSDSDISDSGASYVPEIGDALTTNEAENLGVSGGQAFAEMGFTIEKATVTAKSRALKAEYTLELAQDLKAIHGLDAETELANILSTEILAEINREVIRTVNQQAKIGCLQSNMNTKGLFSLTNDADGRWSVEKFKGLIVQLERESNVIAKETRRGKGNFMICSSDVASILSASGMLDYAPAMNTSLNVDDTGNTFAGTLNGRMRVYIDPYASADYCNVGYKGTNPYDAGLFYCPYVPLTMVRAVGEDTFQPKIGFKTRYGMVSNPFVGSSPADGLATARTNQYYRIFRVDHILT